MDGVPSLPPSGPLRVLAIAGTLAFLALAASAMILWRRREAQAARWACASLVAMAMSFLLGPTRPALHQAMAIATACIALRNAIRFRGSPRALALIGLLGWITALLAARRLFGS